MTNQSPVPTTEPRSVWMRGLFMLLFAILFGIGHIVLNAITVVQFFWLLIKREPNPFLSRFGQSLATWFAEGRPLPVLRHRGEALPLARLAASQLTCAASTRTP